jgi:hypothetical protein
MAVYKIFPTKDTSIYSQFPTSNAGLDQILELGHFTGFFAEVSESIRTLVQFSTEDIQKVLDLGTPEAYKAVLRLNVASASEIPTEFNILANNIANPWVNGVGRYNDTPQNTTGVCWEARGSDLRFPWLVNNFPTGITASFEQGQEGGGDWYISPQVQANFELYSKLDLNLDVTLLIDQYLSGSIQNNGIILRLEKEDSLLNTRLKYFSRDTNSIYPPELQIMWDDSIYDTTLEEINNSRAVITISNIKQFYREQEVQKFRLNVRPQYPRQAFTTSSIYVENYALSIDSQWSIQDYYTKEDVIPFDPDYTKISCDNTSSFFTLYMNGLQPERFYQVIIKTQIDGSTFIIPTGDIFKIQRNV